jgi:monothiol glutaredoxin
MTVQDRIARLVGDHRIVLFMKGTADHPMCGFSMRAVSVLRAVGAEFVDVDVLKDPEIREGVKLFSNWPTIPQLYIDQQFVGGSDIMMEMYESGELDQLVAPKG